jgi:hypothetical protein
MKPDQLHITLAVICALVFSILFGAIMTKMIRGGNDSSTLFDENRGMKKKD